MFAFSLTSQNNTAKLHTLIWFSSLGSWNGKYHWDFLAFLLRDGVPLELLLDGYHSRSFFQDLEQRSKLVRTRRVVGWVVSRFKKKLLNLIVEDGNALVDHSNWTERCRWWNWWYYLKNTPLYTRSYPGWPRSGESRSERVKLTAQLKKTTTKTKAYLLHESYDTSSAVGFGGPENSTQFYRRIGKASFSPRRPRRSR